MLAGKAEQQAAAATGGTTMKSIAAIGLVALGVVHVLIGWLALQLAWGGGDENADPAGAFETLVDQPLGAVTLWVAAAGLLGLAIWQTSEAVWGHQDKQGHARTSKRVKSGARAVGYLALVVIAVRTVTAGSGGSGNQEESVTASILDASAGQFLVAVLALVIVATGASLVHNGATKRFLDDLDGTTTSGQTGRAAVLLGQVGHIAKGVAYGVVGVLFGIAAFTHDAERSGGMDEALGTLRAQPYGQWLLTAVALGLIAYGAYAFAWARSVRARA